jgi:hypothetical protein
MAKLLRKGCDVVFQERFGIKTQIEYLNDVEVDSNVAARFKRSWKRFLPKAKPIISEYRGERLDAFFRQLEIDGTDERYCRRVTIRYISPKVGYGVFATEDIPPYSTLHHYTGILMLDDDIDPDHDSTFSFSEYKDYSIDAMHKGNWTRFMNHGDPAKGATNVIPWEHYIDEGPRVVFTTGRFGVKKGRQLLYSYGDEYWTERKFVSL